MSIQIRKRSGEMVPLDISKIKAVIDYAFAGVDGVSRSALEVECMFQFVDGMETSRIQEIIIETCKNMITDKTPNYSKPAARLISYDLRKRVYRGYEPPKFSEFVKHMVEEGHYDQYILDMYSEKDFEYIDSIIDHERDNNFSLAGMGQLTGKYLLRDRTRPGVFYETPQMMYMAIACVLMAKYNHPNLNRLELVKDFYDGASTFKFSLPTPIMAGVRTNTRQFSSCVLIDTGDELPSINAAASSIVNYVSKRAGIGINHGRIRSEGSSIRNGEMVHTGIVPFIKYHVGALKSCSQGGVRGGSATSFIPAWHHQFEDYIVLKNNRGVAENRERRIDYAIQISDTIYERLLNGLSVYLFDPKEVPDLYEAEFEKDPTIFKNLYQKYISDAENGKIRFRVLPPSDFLTKLLDERAETGRIYVMNSTSVNSVSPFKESKIYQSNLCMEVVVPTRPMKSIEDTDGRIGLCTLASLNMSEFIDDGEQMFELQKYCRALVFALDSLLDYQDYPAVQARESTLDWRTLGIGIVNLADFIMLQGGKYGDPHILHAVNRFMRRMTYYSKEASLNLSKLYGPCRRFKEVEFLTKDLHDQKFDLPTHFGLVDDDPSLDWETLRETHRMFGARHATLFAVAPTESSSQVLNATNGVEMPRAMISVKGSKDGQFKQVVPHPELAKHYDYLWDNANPKSYLKTVAVIQRWVDQSISTNTSYNPGAYGGKLPRQLLAEDLMLAWKLGIKTLYYNNVPDGASDELDNSEVAESPDETQCDTCVV